MTDKQKRFCDEYLIDCNGTRAYKAAYSSVKKDNTAAASAAALLRNPNVPKAHCPPAGAAGLVPGGTCNTGTGGTANSGAGLYGTERTAGTPEMDTQAALERDLRRSRFFGCRV